MIPKELTDWVSVQYPTRKGWIKWATKDKVCICFSETNRDATKTHTLENFLRLYKKARA